LHRLVIAEKPSVGRDLARVLGARERGEGCLRGEGVVVTWAVGHLVRLPEPQEINPEWRPWRRDDLPMLPTEWPLVVEPGTADQFEVVQALLADPQAAEVVCATDAGREGELIFRYIYEKAGAGLPVKRLWISSLTREAIQAGFAALKEGAAFDALADAARGRSRADWLVGMNLTRAYTLAARGLGPSPVAGDGGSSVWSVGRVQTPTLALIVAREQAIRAFVPEAYCEVEAEFAVAARQPEGGAAEALYRGTWFRDKPAPEGEGTSRETRLPADGVEASAIAERVRTGQASIRWVAREIKRRPPPLLYDLTELQRDGNRLFGFSAARTLELAQALYETHKVLSYPRTDSRHLTADVERTLPKVLAVMSAPYKRHLAKGTGQRSLGPRFVDDARVTDHHALLPTNTPFPEALGHDTDEWRIYDLVCRRLLQAWHEDHVSAVTTVVTEVVAELAARHSGESRNPDDPGNWTPACAGVTTDLFHSSGTTVEQVGWRLLEPKAARKGKDREEGEEEGGSLPPGLAEAMPARVAQVEARAARTRPPRPYTEASLLTAMETAGRLVEDRELSDAMRERGLGTPATRAAILEGLLGRGYLERKGRALRATDKGLELVRVVHEDVKSPAMTAEWEHRLKRMERGQEPLEAFLRDIEEWVRGVVGVVGTRDWRLGMARPVEPPPGPACPQGSPGTTGHARTPVPAGKLKRLLRTTFGIEAFRPHQEEVCRALVEGRSALVVMPTGAGKSLCYQLPGVARGGTTLVISPLIALMEDQVASLSRLGLKAERIHSGRDRAASRQACREYLEGVLDFLFVAPERLGVAGFPEMLARRPLSLVAVDEAHCISHWGHDFRPDYRMLRERLKDLAGDAPLIALTATATPRVQDDIAEQLGIPGAERFIRGFRRDNLAIEVAEVSQPDRVAAVKRVLGSARRLPAIVYTPTRKQTEAIADALQRDVRIVAYHAGMTAEARDKAQAAFLNGEADAIVATIAFGMGIDKPDVRTVIHTALPGSVEGYYQEIGRAGRDGKRASAILFHSWGDRRTHEFFHARDYPETGALRRVFEVLGEEPVEREALREGSGLGLDEFEKALEKLWIHGGALVLPDDTVRRGQEGWVGPYEEQRQSRVDRLEEMTRFTQASGCRMSALVAYFGDRADSGKACGLCDGCAPDKVVGIRLRPPTPMEVRYLEALLEALRPGEGPSVGTLFERAFQGHLDRRTAEELLRGLARAGFVTVEEDAFSKDGRVVEFRRVRLVPQRAVGSTHDRLANEVRLPGEDLSKKQARRQLLLTDTPVLRRPAISRDGNLRANEAEELPAEVPAGLVKALKAWRLAEARRRGVPAFRVLTDRVLLGIAALQPGSEEELLQVRGMGAHLMKKHGKAILAVLRDAGGG
jgi:DNA topoisomerase-3